MRNLMKPLLLLWLTIGLTFSFNQAKAQLPTNLSNVKSSQISDTQLMQFLQQAQSSGLSEEQLIQEFKKRGLPEAELEALVNRIQLLTGVELSAGGDMDMDEKKDGKSTNRKYK